MLFLTVENMRIMYELKNIPILQWNDILLFEYKFIQIEGV